MGITEALASHPFKVTWVENRDDIYDDFASNNNENHRAILTLGYILNHDENGSLEVMIELYFSNGQAVLVTYILEKIEGEWQITDFGGMG